MNVSSDLQAREERRAALRGLLPAVDRLRGVRAVEWSGGGRLENGSYCIRYPVYDAVTRDVMVAFDGGPLTGYGYTDTLEVRGLAGQQLDLQELARDSDEELTLALLTGLIRSERFCDGSVAEALREGTLVALLDRLRELYEL